MFKMIAGIVFFIIALLLIAILIMLSNYFFGSEVEEIAQSSDDVSVKPEAKD